MAIRRAGGNVRGKIRWKLRFDAAIGRGKPHGFARRHFLERNVNGAIGGLGIHAAGSINHFHATVGGFQIGAAGNILRAHFAVHRLRGEIDLRRHDNPVFDFDTGAAAAVENPIPKTAVVAPGQTGIHVNQARTLANIDFDFLHDTLGLLAAAGAHDFFRLDFDFIAIPRDDANGAVGVFQTKLAAGLQRVGFFKTLANFTGEQLLQTGTQKQQNEKPQTFLHNCPFLNFTKKITRIKKPHGMIRVAF